MRIVVVGAGPTGLFTAVALARRGHEVLVVDREPGPPPRGLWRRRGVMQLYHAHTFRAPVVDVLSAEMPDVLDELTARRATVARAEGGRPVALLCRRATFDAALRNRAESEPGVVVRTGHVDTVLCDRGGATGVRIDGAVVDADLVIDASGRSGRLAADTAAPGEVDDCGAVYVTRQYRLRDSVSPPMNSPIGLSLALDGYAAIAFVHDDSTFSVTIIHSGSDRRLRDLRHADVFEHAVNSIPGLCEWTDRRRSDPITHVLPGGRLYNSYRGQLDRSGHLAVLGLIAVGDAVCTTTPLAGRGIALALLQARELVGHFDQRSASKSDIEDLTVRFDAWCADNIRPWFVDQRHADGHRLRRWAGADVDLSAPLPSDLIVAAAQTDPVLGRLAGPYSRMDALPASLAAIESAARDIFASGWRPAVPAGPTHDELAEQCAAQARRIA